MGTAAAQQFVRWGVRHGILRRFLVRRARSGDIGARIMIVPSNNRASRSATSRVAPGSGRFTGRPSGYGAPETYPTRVNPFTPLAELLVDCAWSLVAHGSRWAMRRP